jgi:hypothetical protein
MAIMHASHRLRQDRRSRAAYVLSMARQLSQQPLEFCDRNDRSLWVDLPLWYLPQLDTLLKLDHTTLSFTKGRMSESAAG